METMTFIECLQECIKNKDLVSEFNRLTDSKLGVDTRSPIDKAIDNACGYDEQKEYMRKFIDFMYEFIWIPWTNK
jgi:hypothetical protein